MPTMPNIVTLNTNSAETLNNIRANASATYQSLVPEADVNDIATLHQIGEIVTTYDAVRNEFLSALYNRIGRVLITSKMYDNPWASFKKGMLEFGETIEEIFVNIAKPHQFDQQRAETEIFKRVIPDVRSAFHTMNYQKFYKNTISNDQLRQAFLSWNGITDIIGRIVDSMYTGANYDEFIVMKYLLCRLALDGAIKPTVIPEVTSANANSIVSTIKGISNMMTFLSTNYNANGVYTHTPKEEQYVIEDATFNATIDVEVLAKAFNMDKAQFSGQTKLVDSWGTHDTTRLTELFTNDDGSLDPRYEAFTEEELTLLDSIKAMIIDRDFLMCYDNFVNFTEQYNGQGLYWQYWYHTWKTFSASPFHNALLFTTEQGSVTQVDVSPSSAEVAKGATLQLKATVTSTGFADKEVAWSVAGATSPTDATYVDPNGLLHVGADETAKTLTVTATSVYTGGISGSATITVQGN